jgi:anti-sigma factor RsiW
VTRAGTHAAPGHHLDEGTLVRRIDGELLPDESADVEAHLAACADCRAELDRMAALAGSVKASLQLLDAASAGPSRRGVHARSRAWHRSPVWQAAAAIALLAGLAIAIAPVRAWIA